MSHIFVITSQSWNEKETEDTEETKDTEEDEIKSNPSSSNFPEPTKSPYI